MQDDLSAGEMRAWAPRPEPAAPDLRLPGYSGLQLIAQGGEGAVYRARQDGLGRDVAIKALQAVDPATQARFRRELEITVRLGRQHPHIVTVLDTGTLPDGRPCIVMEYHDLGSLHDRLTSHGPLPVAEVVAAGAAVADALAFAHGQGILHRDVKPQNVLVLPTSYVLADFGIARGADAGHSASLRMVSYRHAAPQMLDGAAPAAADDVWSLGSTLFTLLMGAPPFAGCTPDEDALLGYLDRVRSAAPRPLTRTDVPPALAEVIRRCLQKRREDRFPDATALRDALTAVAAELRHWRPPDPDATTTVPGHDDPAQLPDFGPTPTPPAEPGPAPPPLAPEPRGTMTGRLAELTVRHPAPEPPEFGPGAAGPLDAHPHTHTTTAGSPPAAPVTPTRHQATAPPDPVARDDTAIPRCGSTTDQGTAATAVRTSAHAPPDSTTAATPPGASVDTTAARSGERDSAASAPHSTGRDIANSLPAAPHHPASTTPPSPSTTPPSGPSTEHPITSITADAGTTSAPTSQTHADPQPVVDGRTTDGPDRAGSRATPGTHCSPAIPPPATSRREADPTGPTDAVAHQGSHPAPHHLPLLAPHPRPPAGDAGRGGELPTVPQLSPAQIPGFPAMPSPREEARGTQPVRWRRFVVAGVVAAVVGVGIGLLANREGVPVTAPTTPQPTTARIPPGGDRAVAPVLIEVDDRGDSAELVWRDPTGGRAQFVVYDVTEPGGVPEPVTSVAPGLTSFLVPGLDPTAPQYCFQVVAIGIDDPATQRGASGRVCVER